MSFAATRSRQRMWGSSAPRPSAVPGGDPQQNADTARRIFAGERGAARDLAVLNAGAAIYAGGRRRLAGARGASRRARRSTTGRPPPRSSASSLARRQLAGVVNALEPIIAPTREEVAQARDPTCRCRARARGGSRARTSCAPFARRARAAGAVGDRRAQAPLAVGRRDPRGPRGSRTSSAPTSGAARRRCRS